MFHLSLLKSLYLSCYIYYIIKHYIIYYIIFMVYKVLFTFQSQLSSSVNVNYEPCINQGHQLKHFFVITSFLTPLLILV